MKWSNDIFREKGSKLKKKKCSQFFHQGDYDFYWPQNGYFLAIKNHSHNDSSQLWQNCEQFFFFNFEPFSWKVSILYFIWTMDSVIFKWIHFFQKRPLHTVLHKLGGLGTPLNIQKLWFYLTRWIIYDQNNDLDSGLHALYDFWHIDTP